MQPQKYKSEYFQNLMPCYISSTKISMTNCVLGMEEKLRTGC